MIHTMYKWIKMYIKTVHEAEQRLRIMKHKVSSIRLIISLVGMQQSATVNMISP